MTYPQVVRWGENSKGIARQTEAAPLQYAEQQDEPADDLRYIHDGAWPVAPHRCAWARSELAIRYHDEEWGVPARDDRTLFEFLALEGAQAGLSWETILRKRERYRLVFDGFDPAIVARYGPEKVEALLADPGIVRNRAKIMAAITNARAALAVRDEFGSLAAYLWRFVDSQPKVNAWRTLAEVPARTA